MGIMSAARGCYAPFRHSAWLFHMSRPGGRAHCRAVSIFVVSLYHVHVHTSAFTSNASTFRRSRAGRGCACIGAHHACTASDHLQIVTTAFGQHAASGIPSWLTCPTWSTLYKGALVQGSNAAPGEALSMQTDHPQPAALAEIHECAQVPLHLAQQFREIPLLCSAPAVPSPRQTSHLGPQWADDSPSSTMDAVEWPPGDSDARPGTPPAAPPSAAPPEAALLPAEPFSCCTAGLNQAHEVRCAAVQAETLACFHKASRCNSLAFSRQSYPVHSTLELYICIDLWLGFA